MHSFSRRRSEFFHVRERGEGYTLRHTSMSLVYELRISRCCNGNPSSAATKIKLARQVVMEKERGLCKCWHLERTGDSCRKAHLEISEREEVLGGGRGRAEQGSEGRGVKRSLRAASRRHSSKDLENGQAMDLRHPGPMSSQFYGRRSANLLELGWLMVTVSRIPIQTHCVSTSQMVVRISTYRNRRMLGWVTIPHRSSISQQNGHSGPTADTVLTALPLLPPFPQLNVSSR